MNKTLLLKFIAAIIANYKLANILGYIKHFNASDHGCFCNYSKRNTKLPKIAHGEYHRCTACPMLKINTPNYAITCTDMLTLKDIDAKIQETWQLRLQFWTEMETKLREIYDINWFKDLHNIRSLFWDTDLKISKKSQN